MSEQTDKQFDPTPRRLNKAREDGNVLRAKEVVPVFSLMVGGAVLAAGMPIAFQTLQRVMERVFAQSSAMELNVRSVPVLMQEIGFEITLLLAPLFGTLMVTGIAMNIVQSGWNYTTKPLKPKGSRINPLEGIKRLCSAKGLFELLKALLKIALVAPLAYSAITGHLPDILTLHTHALEDAFGTAGSWIVSLVTHMVLALLALSVADFFFEKRRYTQNLKMDHQEIKDEAKDSEGNPQIKGKQRQLARDMLRRPRLDHAVLMADVVITNPTHYAVALRYDPDEADAPFVLVKGIRKRALRIKELAASNRVPTVENRPLARALYGSVDEGKQIPEDLYPAVAAILAEVFRKRDGR